MIKLGFDFDNTIICYEDIFYKLAVEKKLIKESFPKKKKLIREYLINKNLED